MHELHFLSRQCYRLMWHLSPAKIVIMIWKRRIGRWKMDIERLSLEGFHLHSIKRRVFYVNWYWWISIIHSKLTFEAIHVIAILREKMFMMVCLKKRLSVFETHRDVYFCCYVSPSRKKIRLILKINTMNIYW